MASSPHLVSLPPVPILSRPSHRMPTCACLSPSGAPPPPHSAWSCTIMAAQPAAIPHLHYQCPENWLPVHSGKAQILAWHPKSFPKSPLSSSLPVTYPVSSLTDTFLPFLPDALRSPTSLTPVECPSLASSPKGPKPEGHGLLHCSHRNHASYHLPSTRYVSGAFHHRL